MLDKNIPWLYQTGNDSSENRSDKILSFWLQSLLIEGPQSPHHFYFVNQPRKTGSSCSHHAELVEKQTLELLNKQNYRFGERS